MPFEIQYPNWLVGLLGNGAVTLPVVVANRAARLALSGPVARGNQVLQSSDQTVWLLKNNGVPSVADDWVWIGRVNPKNHGNVANQAAMLALSAVPGDFCYRTDLQKRFDLAALPATDLASWSTVPNADLTLENVTSLFSGLLGSSLDGRLQSWAKAYVSIDGPLIAEATVPGPSGALLSLTFELTLDEGEDPVVSVIESGLGVHVDFPSPAPTLTISELLALINDDEAASALLTLRMSDLPGAVPVSFTPSLMSWSLAGGLLPMSSMAGLSNALAGKLASPKQVEAINQVIGVKQTLTLTVPNGALMEGLISYSGFSLLAAGGPGSSFTTFLEADGTETADDIAQLIRDDMASRGFDAEWDIGGDGPVVFMERLTASAEPISSFRISGPVIGQFVSSVRVNGVTPVAGLPGSFGQSTIFGDSIWQYVSLPGEPHRWVEITNTTVFNQLVPRPMVPGYVPENELAAVLSTALSGTNNDLTFTARSTGYAGNDISVTFAPTTALADLLSVEVGSSNSITVNFREVLTLAGAEINWALGIRFRRTLSAATPFSVINAVNGQTIEVYVTQPSGQSYATTWPPGVTWAAGAPGTIAANTSIKVTLVATSSSTWNGSFATGATVPSTSTAAQVKAAIEAEEEADALVVVTYPSGNNGSGAVAAYTGYLMNGSDGTLAVVGQEAMHDGVVYKCVSLTPRTWRIISTEPLP